MTDAIEKAARTLIEDAAKNGAHGQLLHAAGAAVTTTRQSEMDEALKNQRRLYTANESLTRQVQALGEEPGQTRGELDIANRLG